MDHDHQTESAPTANGTRRPWTDPDMRAEALADHTRGGPGVAGVERGASRIS